MKLVASFAAAALLCCLASCATDSNKDTAAPGAVSANSCCSDKSKAGCCEAGKASCDEQAKKDAAASPGAVGETKSGGCCADKAKTASPGAVGEKPAGGCCHGAGAAK